jgi:hypothetical protein
MEPYCQSYLKQYNDQGVVKCTCGGEHRLQTRKILLGEGVMESMPAILEQGYGSAAKIWSWRWEGERSVTLPRWYPWS